LERKFWKRLRSIKDCNARRRKKERKKERKKVRILETNAIKQD
jgi:hypothetical protein